MAMHLTEAATFDGSGLDRAVGLRGEDHKIAALRPHGRFLPVWHGQVPVGSLGALVWVAADAAIMASTLSEIFLGFDGDIPCFAADISTWQPDTSIAQTGHFDSTCVAHSDLSTDSCFVDLRNIMAQLSPREAELAVMTKAMTQWHSSHGFCAACGKATTTIMAGWQRKCSDCNAVDFPRIDPVVIMLVERHDRLLLGRSPGWPEGMYSLLAGFMEPGETLEAAVRREVLEEAGISVGDVRYLASQPWPFPASLMLGVWAQATSDAITIDAVELEDAIWVTRDELVEVLAGRHPRIKPGRKGAIAGFIIKNWLSDRLS